MRVAFRADASSQIGLGHLRRCLTLALALRKLGAEPLFLLRRSDVRASDVLDREALPWRLLDALPTVTHIGALPDADADARACIAALKSVDAPALVVVDHYGLEASWHEAVRTALKCRIAVIDDLADRPLCPDALIDQNLCLQSSHRERYAACLRQMPKRWFCGPGFALLGESYAKLPKPEPSALVRSLGIFLGGTDPLNLSPVALQACRGLAGFEGPVEIVSTSANPHLAALRQAVANDGNTQLSLDLPELSAFYARHDLQIGAAGGAAWERCAVGVPSLTLSLADNQDAVLPELQRREAVLAAKGLEAAAIATGLRLLIDDAQLRRRLAENSRRLVDGQGARKVAIGLMLLAGQNLALRPAAMTDAECIWRWRNHPAIRAVSRQSQEIPLQAHQAWMQGLLDAGHSRLYLAELGEQALGVIRFDPLPDSAGVEKAKFSIAANSDSDPDSNFDATFEVSLYLAPELQGLGLGSALLRAGEERLQAEHAALQQLRIHAEVLPGNEASHALFLAADYRASAVPLHFIKTLKPSSTN